ncbi:hypothetical protein E9840_09805 [Tissierella creatinini]|nr:hypothetical protein E9840_09805 [Tissierella creatinini]TJX64440.1 hypothetical protein E8P77_12355 [Soehngenia saccharolytica]
MNNITFYLILILSLLLGGCIKEPNLSSGEQDSVSVQAQDEDIIEKSETISDAVVELYGIDDATSIVINDEVLIGVKIAYDEKMTLENRDLIMSRVQSIDEGITNIYISDNENIFGDINDVVTDILQGKSYESSLNIVNNIKTRIK